jgi:DNA polymerase-3 subunit beta
MAGLVKAQAGSLAAALGFATLPANEKQARRTPALGAVRLAGDDNGLHVSITGINGTIATAVKAEAEGEMALPLQRLADLVSAFPAGAELTIAGGDNAATVSFGKSRFRLPLFPLPDLPARYVLEDETGRVSLDAKIARDLFSRPAFAVSTETTRFNLNGVFLHNAGSDLVAVATDGHRLARATAAASSTLSTDRALIVPRAALRPINRLLGKAFGNVVLRRSERLFSVEGARFAIVTKRIDSTFPNYERVIPREHPNTVTTSRAALSESIARFAAVADIETHAVSLRWNANGLTLSAPDGSADCLAGDFEGEAETTIQTRYLAELLEALHGDAITIAAGRPGGPITITDDNNFLALQMPIWPRPG